MWSTITNLKDNIKSIAADVLETQEEIEADAFERSGPAYTAESSTRSSISPASNVVDKDSQLQWYAEELKRMQASESDVQTMSTTYVNALKEQEAEAGALRQQNEDLKKQLIAKPANGSEPGGELAELRERLKVLQNELHQTIDSHQEQVSALQDSHRKRSDILFSRHRREIENLQAELKSNGGQAGNHEQLAINGHAVDKEGSTKRIQELESKVRQVQDKERDYARQAVEKDQAFGKLRDAFDRGAAEIKQLKGALGTEQAALAETRRIRESDHASLEATLQECTMLKAERHRMAAEMGEVRKRLEDQEASFNEARESWQHALSDQTARVASLQAENDTLQQALTSSQVAFREASTAAPHGTMPSYSEQEVLTLRAIADSKEQELRGVTQRLKDLEQTLQRWEEEVASARAEKEKAARDLGRLKQHLLDMESADAEKMERDLERLADLEAKAQSSESRAAELEVALLRAQADAAEARQQADDGVRSTSGELENLRRDLAGCQAALESKDVELQNLQMALGQYYAEAEAHERVHMELSSAREALAKLAEDLRIATSKIDIKEDEKQKALARAGSLEQQLAEGTRKAQKLQEEVAMLRRALEQSMIRINRMSTDSDFSVDRRIVIKLMVTYFQKNHSKEVLDLMARILGFSDEEKTRVGLAQQQGGMVRGVLGGAGRLVGGLLRGVAQEADTSTPPDENTSFGEVWIDFLLKESEERERREAADRPRSMAQAILPSSPRTPSSSTNAASSPPRFYTSLSPRSPPLSSYSLSSRNLSPTKSPSLSAMPTMFSSPENEVSSGGAQSNGFLLTNVNLAPSPISAADVAYMNSGEFSAVPLNSSTPPPSVSNSPYTNTSGRSRSLPRPL